MTQLIKRIESRLGTPIINRDKKPYSLTQAGLLYYQYLESVSYNKQQLNKKLAKYTHPNKEIIKIGILESLGTYLLPEILPDFLKRNPQVEIQLIENFPRENEKNLLSGNIDCYIGQTPEAIDSSLDCEVVPFYATPRKPAIHHTMGGLKIDTGAHVLDKKSKQISGLYAAGEVAGGIHAGNRLGGNSLADIFTFGRIVANSANDELEK